MGVGGSCQGGDRSPVGEVAHRGKQSKALRRNLLSDQGDLEGWRWGRWRRGFLDLGSEEGDGEDRFCQSWCQGWGQSELLKCKDHHKVLLVSLGV